MTIKQKFLLMLFALFTVTSNIHAQKFFPPDSLSKPIKLPEKFSLERSNFEIGKRSKYRYIISDTTRYYSVFKSYSKDSLPQIDFTINELLLYVYCSQCLVSCRGDEPCHRNGCRYTYTWHIRKKKLY